MSVNRDFGEFFYSGPKSVRIRISRNTKKYSYPEKQDFNFLVFQDIPKIKIQKNVRIVRAYHTIRWDIPKIEILENFFILDQSRSDAPDQSRNNK